MASAMSGSRGRASKHPRWASLILARLPLLVLLAFVLANMNHPVKAENEPDPPGEAEEEVEVSLILKSCDDLPDERTEVFGIVAVMGDILCKENRIFQSISKEVVVFVADAPTTFKGVQFEVPKDTQMLFGAPGFTFERAHQDSTQQIFSVNGTLRFFPEGPLPVPLGSTREDKHSIMRVEEGGSVAMDGEMYFTDSSVTVAKGAVAPDPIDQDPSSAQRPRHQSHAPPPFSMFTPPLTAHESFGERLRKSPMYLYAGEELHWPSSMSSEDGSELTLGVDGSMLFQNQAAAADAASAATAAYVGAESNPVVPPLVTLVAADARKANRALKKRLTGGRKAVDVDFPGQKDGLKVPGCVGRDAGGKTVLTLTDVGDVDVTIDGKRVLHKTAPNNERTWRKKFFDRVKGRKRPKGDYQMHLVSDGFEIRLDGATIWGVHAADLPPVAS